MAKKIGRNEPCPCGSGKKYKNCCLKRANQHEGTNPASEVLDEIRHEMGNREFQSLEEMQGFLDMFMEKRNRKPDPRFLGLSPEQMHRLLYQPLENVNDIVSLNNNMAQREISSVPVVKDCRLFLERFAELEPLRSTAKGNLPLKFVRELFPKVGIIFPGYRFGGVRSEQEAIFVLSLRHILAMCGWIRKEKGYFKLTKKGRKVVVEAFTGDDYLKLFHVFTRRFNWPFQDRYPEFRIVQQSYLFSIYLVRTKASEFTEADVLGNYFIEAFPDVLREAGERPWPDPSQMVRDCFSLRFLERFCEYFGFVETKREEKSLFRRRLFVKASDFLESCFTWHGP